VELEPVTVNIYELQLLSVEGCEASLLLHCSAGTYVRSIAHDAGQALGCGAFLKSLRRIASGDFNIERARTLEELAALAHAGRLQEALIPAAELLPAFPAELVDAITAGHIRNGRDFRVSPFQVRAGTRFVKAVEAGGAIKDVCREHELSEATYYKWKAKYGGMEAADIKRLRELEEENRRLKHMYAELSLDHQILKEVLTKKL